MQLHILDYIYLELFISSAQSHSKPCCLHNVHLLFMKNALKQQLQRIGLHILGWSSYLVVLLVLGHDSNYSTSAIGSTIVHILFIISLVYLNWYYLIPKYLRARRVLKYIGFTGLSILIAGPLEIFLMYICLQSDKVRQTQLLLTQNEHILFLFLSITVSTFLRVTSQWIIQERDRRILEYKNLQTELSFLKTQINPHFLFNTLNSLYALSLKKSEKSPEMILHLSEMMRYMLYKSNEKYVPLKQEINYINNYLALERIRYGNNIRIVFDYQGQPINDYLVAPLLFTVLIENSFKHGINKSIQSGFVELLLILENNTIDFTIQNSKATTYDKLYKKGGIGLKNIRRRLELIYPKNHSLSIYDEADVYIVNLTLNLNNTYD